MRYLLATLAIAAVPLSAHTVVPAGFPEIIAESTFIVRGHVTDVRAARLTNGAIETVATVAVDHVLKGGSSEFISVHLPGGAVGDARFAVAGAPSLRAADRAVFFLKRAVDNGWHPIGLSMGIYRLHHDARTGLSMVNPPLVAGETASIGRVVRGNPKRKPLPLSEFESLVRLVMLTKPVGGKSR